MKSLLACLAAGVSCILALPQLYTIITLQSSEHVSFTTFFLSSFGSLMSLVYALSCPTGIIKPMVFQAIFNFVIYIYILIYINRFER